MSQPKFRPTRKGYALWKEQSMKDVHVRPFTYTFRGIEVNDICDPQDSGADRDREEQKFVYDTRTKDLCVTFSGTTQSGVIDAFIKLIRESLRSVPPDEDAPTWHTNAISGLYQNVMDERERYRIVGDLLVTNGAGPRFGIETAVRGSLPAVEDKVQKWFLVPSMVAVVLVRINEGDGYRKPTSGPRENETFLVNSWAWLNYVVDINEGVDLLDCTKPVIYDGHVWYGSFSCTLELYERDFSNGSSQCKKTRCCEVTMPGYEKSIEVTEELRSFREHFIKIWCDAVEGNSLEGFKQIELDWDRLGEYIAKSRLVQAYERYRSWFMTGPKRRLSPLQNSLDNIDPAETEVVYWKIARHL